MLETVALFFTSPGGGVSEDWLSGRDEFGESEGDVEESVNKKFTSKGSNGNGSFQLLLNRPLGHNNSMPLFPTKVKSTQIIYWAQLIST